MDCFNIMLEAVEPCYSAQMANVGFLSLFLNSPLDFHLELLTAYVDLLQTYIQEVGEEA